MSLKMRLLLACHLFLLVVFALGCTSAKRVPDGAESTSASNKVSEAPPKAPVKDLWVTCYGFGPTKGSSLQNAIQNGFRALLQDGFPGDYFPQPLLGKNGKQIIKDNPAYFDRFFNSDMHLFVLDREIFYFEYKSKDEPSSKISIFVNIESLKNQLIKDKILVEGAPVK